MFFYFQLVFDVFERNDCVMDEKFKKQMEENGADVDATLNRFMGREAIYMKFLLKFAEDRSCRGIRENLEKQDVKEAFNQAHSLKGVSGNLGLVPVHMLAAQISDLLREKQIEEIEIDKVMDLQTELEEMCERFYQIIEESQA